MNKLINIIYKTERIAYISMYNIPFSAWIIELDIEECNLYQR